jgi:flagellar motor switch protein FliM
MADDVLTSDEVESLLRASERAIEKLAPAGSLPTDPPAAGRRIENIPIGHQSAPRLSRELMESLHTLHERLARNLTVALAPVVRGIVQIKLGSIITECYAEFSAELENPTCLNLLVAPPLEENLLLEISPSIAYPMIDRMLGGGREMAVVAKRPLTPIERRLMGRVTTLFGQELRRAWQTVIDVSPAVERVETNPQLLEIFAPDEPIVAIKFELAIGESRGNMTLCLSLSNLATIRRASAREGAMRGASNSTASTTGLDISPPAGPTVELVVHLARTKIGAAELAGLEVGDMIATGTPVNSPLPVSLDGAIRFHGRPGAFQGRKAVRLTEAIENSPPSEPPVESEEKAEGKAETGRDSSLRSG